jgi:long-subunit acyl-CoA synthetase (AMP-forming)
VASFEVTAHTLCEAFQTTASREPDAIALRSAEGPQTLTWAQYAGRVRRVAAGLAALGVDHGDTVGLMLVNRIEFFVCDTAALHLGACPFSIYNTSSPEQIAHLFANAGNAVVITERQFLARVREHAAHVVCVDGPADGASTLDELESLGEANDAFDFEASWRAVTAGDLATLIYTSGTTGPSKGVELTHAGVLAECRGLEAVLPMPFGATMTSYLPSAHVADRTMSQYSSIVFGVQLTTVADMRRIGAVIAEMHPTIWGAVPRVFEKLVAGLRAAIDADDTPAGVAARHALDVSLRRVRMIDGGHPVPAALQREHTELDATVLAAVRRRIGLDRAAWLASGAAPLSRDVQEVLLALGLPLTEVYGMSECSCIIAVSPVHEARIGTVGTPIPGVEVRRAVDGELLVRGDILMRGYRSDPIRTAEVLGDDGWLHTGDVGEIDPDGHIRIVDRKKELIINSAGKNMSPANIEDKLKSAGGLVGQAICIGDGRPYNVALLVLDPDAADACAHELGIGRDRDELVAHEGVRGRIAQAVEHANEQLSRVEQIKRYAVLSDEWPPGGDELTPTMKLKRKPIAAKYAATIEELYAQR